MFPEGHLSACSADYGGDLVPATTSAAANLLAPCCFGASDDGARSFPCGYVYTRRAGNAPY